MKKIILAIIIAIFSLNFANAGGYKTAEDYGINKKLEQKLNSILKKITVKILNNGGKEGKLYKNISKKIELLKNKSEKNRNLLNYIDSYLNIGIENFGSSFGKNDEEVLEDFINNFIIKINGGVGNQKRIDLDIETVKKYKNNYINLFKENKLPILHKFEIGGNKIFITGAYKNNYTNKKSKDCGYYFSPGGVDGYNLCVAIIHKQDGTYDVNAGGLVYTEWTKYKNIELYNDKYIITNYFNGDSCGGGGVYKLLDKNLNLLNTLNISESACEISISEYNIGDFNIGFYSKLNGDGYKKGNISYKIFEEKLSKYNDNYKDIKKIKEYKVTDGNKFTFDYKNNLLTSYFDGKINFKIGNKNYKKDILNIKSKNTLFIENDLNVQLKLLELKKIGNNYKIIGKLNIGETDNNINKIEILSCKNNGKYYDSEYYKLKKFIIGDKEFAYNISEKYGNLCNIPYIIKITNQNGNIIKKEFSLER